MASSIDDLRALTVGAKKNFRTEKVDIEGAEFEVRQPSVKARDALMEKCTDKEGKLKMSEFLSWGIILNTYKPGTDEKVFSDADYKSIIEQPAGGWVDKLGNTAARLLNVQEDEDSPKGE